MSEFVSKKKLLEWIEKSQEDIEEFARFGRGGAGMYSVIILKAINSGKLDPDPPNECPQCKEYHKILYGDGTAGIKPPPNALEQMFTDCGVDVTFVTKGEKK